MNQPKLFYFDNLKTWDKATILFYILTSVIVAGLYNVLDINSKKYLIVAYAIGTHFLLYLFNYKSLRNLRTYFFWLFMGFIHLFFYFLLKDEKSLYFVNGHAARALGNTTALLLMYQLLRFVSLKIQQKELVCPSWGGGRDFFDNRKVTFIDFALFIVYIGATMLLAYY